MSYTPDDQLLEEPIDRLLKAIDEVQSVCTARIRSGDWKQAHIDEINGLRNNLNDLEIQLRDLMRKTR